MWREEARVLILFLFVKLSELLSDGWFCGRVERVLGVVKLVLGGRDGVLLFIILLFFFELLLRVICEPGFNLAN